MYCTKSDESRDSAGVLGASCESEPECEGKRRVRLSCSRRRWSLNSSSLLSTLVAELAIDHTESLCVRGPRCHPPGSDAPSPPSDASSDMSSSTSFSSPAESSIEGLGEVP